MSLKPLLIVSAETSSCEYVTSLLAYWKTRKLELETFGIGNRAMQAEGFNATVSSEDLGSFGLSGLYSKYRKLKAIMADLLSEVEAKRPGCALLLDYSGFNLRLAKELKSRGVPVVYYVSPQVWAWDRGRTERIKQYVDHMLCLFPFEIEHYQKHSVEAEFVGHPAVEKLKDEYFDEARTQLERARFGFMPGDHVLGIMPGSRRAELDNHFPVIRELIAELAPKYQNLKFAFLSSPNFEKEDLAPYLAGVDVSYVLLKNEPMEMIRLVDSMLVASGTATLMVGLLEKPMVIFYKASWLTGYIGRKVIQVPFVCILNLIAGREIVPERIQEQVNTRVLGPLVDRMISDLEYRKTVKADLNQIRQTLSGQNPTRRVAEVLEGYLLGEKQDV